ncbi:L-fucose:H+ symporter permease [Flectobacillus longus]|uniref:L-fucose:H+ symporter permease n=1 Tax=Flectobacillus longus TaxID=2984207 RepID=UPI0024B7FA37|nr:L-fucose:H+ symporter permease [Flectobacillus longus]MDI9881545.1 L-fucose:H+ symporter permease [Flectobacillus longus]
MSKIKASLTERRYLVTFAFVTSLFMLWGIAHAMSDVLNKHFQNVLQVSKAQSGLIQLSVFGAYAIMSIPAGLFMKRFGYRAGILFGLGLFASGTFLFVPAANAESFNMFRLALFVLGCGMATLETVAHPLAALLGAQETSDQRLNFSQSFNALGTIIGPAIGSFFLLRAGNQEHSDLSSVKTLYVSIGIAISIIAVLFSLIQIPHLSVEHHAEMGENSPIDKPLWQQSHFVWAVIAQFFNVAAQAGTWSFFINYGHEIMGFSDEQAANYMIIFMTMMALGRFAGTFLMKFIAPNKLLGFFATGSILSCLVVAQAWGWVSYSALMLINFFFSIMFPTIFSLGLKSLGKHTQQGASFISMGVVGGAFFPLMMGLVANHNVAKAYYLPIICYLMIAIFAFRLYKIKK